MPKPYGTVNISVYTDGYTKIFQIIDKENEEDLEYNDQDLLAHNAGEFDYFEYNLPSSLKLFEK